jgi:CDP-paratose 2-epimerase
MHRVLVTGGCGFVGTNLSLHFASKTGVSVLAIDNLSRKGVEINAHRLEKAGVEVIRRSVQDSVAYATEWEPDVILNCAAQSSATGGMVDPMRDFYDNLETVACALEIARASRSCFLQWSTNKVYPAEAINKYNTKEETTRYKVDELCSDLSLAKHAGSRSIYGATKVAAEALIEEWSRAYNIPTIVNRFSCLAGKYQLGCADQGWVAIWVISHMFGNPLTYYGWKGKQVRDVLAVDDLCDLITKQVNYLQSHLVCETYNVGGGSEQAISLIEATTMCQQITGNTVDITVSPDVRWADHRVYVSDIERVCAKFDWHPVVTPRSLLRQIQAWAETERGALEEHYCAG